MSDPLEIHRKTQAQQRQRQALANEVRREVKQVHQSPPAKTSSKKAVTRPSVKYDFPSSANYSATRGYKTGFGRLLQMAEGSVLFSLSEAVFVTEAAFYNQQGGYDEFRQGLELVGAFLLREIQLVGHDPESNLDKNLMIFRMFTDTLRTSTGEIYHLPYEYDFEDYRGDLDYSKMFVRKLLRENSGQCHSLPLLFLMLAEVMEAEAYLAYSPSHTYVKIPLPTGGYQNLELTSDVLTSDAHILQSGYIGAEALQHGLYMKPLTQRQLLSHCMADMAQGYMRKFGPDPFVLKVLNSALELWSNNIYALLMKSDYNTLRFQYVLNQTSRTEATFEQWLANHPAAARLYDQMLATYDQVDRLGYAEMPKEAYEEWLHQVAQERGNQANRASVIRLKQQEN